MIVNIKTSKRNHLLSICNYNLILVYHFRSGNTATTLSIANLYWLVKSYSNATVTAVKVADNVYDLYTNNSGTY